MTEYQFHPATLHDRWRLVTAAASRDGKPSLQQVQVELHERGIRLTATDSYVLATVWVPEVGSSNEASDFDAGPIDAFSIGARDRTLDALLAERGDNITLRTGEHSLTFSTPLWSIQRLTDRTDQPKWKHLFTPTTEPTSKIAVGLPVFQYFNRVADLLTPEYSVMMRWYNEAAFQFDIAQHQLRGLAMPIRLP